MLSSKIVNKGSKKIATRYLKIPTEISVRKELYIVLSCMQSPD